MAFVTAGDSVKIAYEEQGSGVPLLCLPGLTRNMEDFEPVLEAYAGKVRVIRVDFRGRGASDFADPSTYTPPQEAQDVVALLDHLGLEDAVILGTSRGGLVALMLAVMAKARLRGVIFNDVGPEIMAEGLANIMDYIGKPPSFPSLDAAAAAMPILYDGVFMGVAEAQWRNFVRRIWREEGGALHLRYDPRLRDAVAPAFAPDAVAPDLWPLFDALEGVPLGLIRGRQSNILSSETAAEMRRRRPDMAFAELDDRGHVPFLDEPGSQAVIDAVLEAAR
ncbi:alpha/beta hydrolase [Gymnodinialimonas sp. 2305UL16-5]|uniref:alpha/beta fold hydrolase n=1 Tax=Gymnodinialimonas mytili TaxID=3126503 RepID=UPI0030A8BE1B